MEQIFRYALVLVLLGLTHADEYHKSAVRSRRVRDVTDTTRPIIATTTATTTAQPPLNSVQPSREDEEISSHTGEIREGPVYTEDDEPCEDDVRNIHDHNRTKKKTCSLEGTWYNSLGSEMILNVSSDGFLTGEYRTAVEKGWGSAGEGHSKIFGHSHPSSNPSFGITVIWNEGESVTSWTGQCLICNGIETMETTWVLSTKVDSCRHNWMSNRIGQDSFTRREQSPGPRKSLHTHTPRDFWRVPKPDKN